MAQHADILDDRESLRNPFFASVGFHAGIAALIYLFTVVSHANRITLGTTNPGYGSAVSVNSVHTIPLMPRHGPTNPVAHDTENVIPQRQPEKPQPKQQVHKPEPPKNAIPIKSRAPEKPAPHDYLRPQYQKQPARPNQVYSREAPAAVNPMYQKPGSTAGVGLNPNSLVGTQFGAYGQALMEAVGNHWNTGGLSGRTQTAVVNVDILRDGSIRNPKIVQSSGNYDIDRSALRAVTEAVNQPYKIPPLPREYSGSFLNVDFLFQLHP